MRYSFRFILGLGALLSCAPAISRNARQDAAQPIDFLVLEGTVVDGSGTSPFRADVGVRGDRIVFVGDAAAARVIAIDTINASGLIVAPGFIDAHVGFYLDSVGKRVELAALHQGVTTIIGAKDGFIRDFFAAADSVRLRGSLTNVALFAPLCSFRARVAPGAGRPTAAQMDSIRALVARSMAEGALGLSTGLYYAPCSFFSTGEVLEFAKVAAAAGGIYDSHIRDEGAFSIGVLAALDEAIRIGREARMPVVISHIKALGPAVWGYSDSMTARIRRARTEGVEVWATHYPYNASGTNLVDALVPRTGDFAGWRERGRSDPAFRRRLIGALSENIQRRGGAGSIVLMSASRTEWIGENVSSIAKAMNLDPAEAVLALLESSRRGNENIISFNMSQADVDNFATQDFVMTTSDGGGDYHPRTYGAFARKFRDYVRERRMLSLATAVRASSGLTAEVYRLAGRGKIATGYFADIAVFDSSAVRDMATYVQPNVLAQGTLHVLVNGTPVIRDGRYSGVIAGRFLPRGSPHSR